MIRFLTIALIILALTPGRAAHAATVTQTSKSSLTIVIQNVLLPPTFTPTAPTVPCNIAPGTVVSAVSFTGGDSNPIALSLSGDTTDFALSAATAPANIIVGPNGIASADCGLTELVTVTGTQP